MATRSGSVDPGLLLWVLRHGHLTVDELEDALDRRAGLSGLSGVSGDLREVLHAADGGDARSQLAFGVYVHRLRAEVGAMVAAMDGIDGLVFTGGAGEGSARLRHDACSGLGFLGIELDEQRNSGDPGPEPDRVVSRQGTAPAVLVVHAREDLEIARQVRATARRSRLTDENGRRRRHVVCSMMSPLSPDDYCCTEGSRTGTAGI